uniref:LOW QUALITY PROTEIN: coilin-like n=1 Tax=Oncorhynchus gorbuscha TaxID=8017 RepID=UPI001EAEDE28|nr:LOW QUALITY PROTEIN: coilin-like [Oncorhynchus gorbuscha]
MAASNTNVIRVRLYFDYPPPSVSDCRMCWVLVDLNKCRVVADIASVIREKFDFSRRSILSLFIEDCYLPHTESIYVVRDNDSIRVKVDTLTLSSGSQSNTSVVKSKKRRRAAEEEPTQNRVSEEWKKKKKKRKESQEADSNEAVVEERRKENKQKQKKKKDKKVATKTTASSTGPSHTSSTGPSHTSSTGPSHTSSTGPSHTSSTGPPPTSSTGPSPTIVKADKNTKKAPSAKVVSVNGKATAKTPNGEMDDSSDSSESSSEEEEAPSKTPMQKLPPKSHSASSTPPVTSKATPVVKPRVPVKKPRPPPSSDSDSSDSSGDDASSKATTGQPPVKNQTPLSKPAATIPTGSGAGPRDKTTHSRPSLPSSGPRTSVSPGQRANALGPGSTPAVQKAHRRPESPGSSSSSSSSSEEIQLVIKQPGLGMGIVPAMAAQPTWRGRGSPMGAERGDNAGFYFNYEGGQRQQTPQPPSYQKDSLINSSVVFQNPSESVPKRDYSEMPLLAAPPQDGQKIAFKLLELTENYTPEVSEYKEGKIIHFDHSTKQIELELLSTYQGKTKRMTALCSSSAEYPHGSESVEYAVSRGSRVTERWDSLLEPRLVVGNLS